MVTYALERTRSRQRQQQSTRHHRQMLTRIARQQCHLYTPKFGSSICPQPIERVGMASQCGYSFDTNTYPSKIRKG